MNSSQELYHQTYTGITGYLQQELALVPMQHYSITASDEPRLLIMTMLVNPRYAHRIEGMSEALSMAAGLDKGASIRVSRGNRGSLCLEIPKPGGLWFNVPLNKLPGRRGFVTSVGVSNERRPVRVDFTNALSPHVLLAGATGSGKTNLLKLLAYRLASQNSPDQAGMILVDTRKAGANWRPFAHLPHLLHPVITDDAMALRALSWACAEIDRRATSGKKSPHIFVGIDEAQDLLERDEFVKVIGDLAATGREFNVHLLAALQNPTAKQLGDTSIKRNLTTRLVGRVDSATAAVVATGQEKTGAEKLVGAGDFLLVDPLGVSRMTAALLASRDTDGLPTADDIPTLDLGGYDDVDHVLAQADNGGKAGRYPDPIEPKHLAFALVYQDASLNEYQRRFSIRRDKAKRVIGYAQDLLGELSELDAHVACLTARQEAGTVRYEIESEYHFLDPEDENSTMDSVPYRSDLSASQADEEGDQC